MPTPIATIQHAICREFNLTREELLSSSRKASVAHVRALAVMVARELTQASYPALGRAFAGRHHTTILSAERRGRDLMEKYPEYVDKINRVREALRNQQ